MNADDQPHVHFKDNDKDHDRPKHRKRIPSVQELLDSAPVRNLFDKLNRNVVTEEMRSFVEGVRDELRSRVSQWSEATVPSAQELADRLGAWLRGAGNPKLRPVINATGTILHAPLGQAPIADAAVAAVVEVSRSYCSLELDLGTGQPVDPLDAVTPQLCQLTGADAALVVNNHAAATCLALAALAADREVIVSRGQLPYCPGRRPLVELARACRATLREVGATNATRLSDYAEAINPSTAVLMRIAPTNFAIEGFAQSVSLADLVALGRRQSVTVIDDVGSAGLLDDPAETSISITAASAVQSIRSGADLVIAQGDQRLGGPRCGILLGSKDVIDRLQRHPLAATMDVDRITLAALAATLTLYHQLEVAREQVPSLSLSLTQPENLRHRAERIAMQLRGTDGIGSIEVVPGEAYLSGDPIASQRLATWRVAIVPTTGTAADLAVRLRRGSPAIVARVIDERLVLDLRSVRPAEDAQIVRAFGQRSAMAGEESPEAGHGAPASEGPANQA